MDTVTYDGDNLQELIDFMKPMEFKGTFDNGLFAEFQNRPIDKQRWLLVAVGDTVTKKGRINPSFSFTKSKVIFERKIKQLEIQNRRP